jgi:hypothetical protein
MQDGRPVRRQLKRIAIAARDDGASIPALFLTRDRGGEEIVCLVACCLGVGEAAGADEIGQDVELLDQLTIEMPAALIIRKELLPVGRRAQRIPADEHGARTFALVKAQEKIGEADDRAGAFIALAADRLRQRVIGAVRERIAVDDEKRAARLCAICHRVSWLARRSRNLTEE